MIFKRLPFSVRKALTNSTPNSLSLKLGKTLLLSLFIFFIAGKSISQPFEVHGNVKDLSGNPIENVSVRVKGGSATAITDINGDYKIKVPSTNATLVFKHVRFNQEQKKVEGKDAVDLKMTENISELNEVVLIPYGKVKRTNIIGVFGKVNVQEMQKAPVTSFDQALAGRVAGVEANSGDGQPGAAVSITIRGSSVSQDASPLFVIDGFPLENFDVNSLNPNEIETFEVLKDASSISIYGARGANGVILITTKRAKAGKPIFSYGYNIGIQQVTKKIPLLSPKDFVALELELDSVQSTSTNQVSTFHDLYLGARNPQTGLREKTLAYYDSVKGTDWLSQILQTGLLQNHTMSVSGGNPDSRYIFNGSYTDNKGIIVFTGFQRYMGNLTLTQKMSDKITLGVDVRYSASNSFGTIPANGGTQTGAAVQGNSSVVYSAWAYPPVLGLHQPVSGYLIDTASDGTVNVNGTVVNPYQQASNEYRKSYTNTSYANLSFDYIIIPSKFFFRSTIGYTGTNARTETFYNSNTAQGLTINYADKNGIPQVTNLNGVQGGINTQRNYNIINENVLSYRWKYTNRHVFDAVAGFSQQYAANNSDGFTVYNIPLAAQYLGIHSLGSGKPYSAFNSSTGWRLYSFFGRINYTLDDKYLFTGSARSDGSSKFAPGKEWGYFGSGAFAWRFSSERFAQKFSSWLSEGKLRVSYGSVGNNRVGDFSYQSQFGSFSTSAGYPFSNTTTYYNTYTPSYPISNDFYGYQIGTDPYFYGNKNLTWEQTRELDLGMTLALFNNKLNIETDFYIKKTVGMLLTVPIPAFGGYSSGGLQYENAGDIRNDGLELTINNTNISKKNFTWITSFNITFNTSRILSFYNGTDVIQTGWSLYGNSTAWVAKVGQPLAQFYGYVSNGNYQYSDFNRLANGSYALKNGIPNYANKAAQPGDPKFKDLNGDGIIDQNDETVIGRAAPIHFGGINNTFSYKEFSLSIFLQWKEGNNILNANKAVFETGDFGRTPMNQFATEVNRWSPTNPTNDIPRARFNTNGGDDGNTVARVSSRYIEDGSFLRFKTISLNYSVKHEKLVRYGLQGFKAFISAQNILTLTKYSGIDPEVSTFKPANPSNAAPGTAGQNVSGGTGYTFVQPSSGYAVLAPGYDYTPYPRAFTVSIGFNVNF